MGGPGRYDEFYKTTAWEYDIDKEKDLLDRLILKPLHVSPGSKVLEIGCGQGYHSYALHLLGYEVVGNDLSAPGIEFASSAFPGPTWINCDTRELLEREDLKDSFDMLFVRGHSWYHYEITKPRLFGKNVPELTRQLFGLVKPGGVFVLQIRSDFSGQIRKDGVYNNLFDDYVNLFAPLGKIELISDWNGLPLKSDKDARASGQNIIIGTRKS